MGCEHLTEWAGQAKAPSCPMHLQPSQQQVYMETGSSSLSPWMCDVYVWVWVCTACMEVVCRVQSGDWESSSTALCLMHFKQVYH